MAAHVRASLGIGLTWVTLESRRSKPLRSGSSETQALRQLNWRADRPAGHESQYDELIRVMLDQGEVR